MAAFLRFLLAFLLIAVSARVHEEDFGQTIEEYRRQGHASLRVFPSDDGLGTIYEFRTSQRGVSDMLGFRVAIQWWRNVRDNQTTDYECAVFQFAIPQSGDFDNHALTVVQTGLNYNQFSNLYGAGLGLDDYIKAVLFNKTGFVRPADYSRYYVTTQQVKKYQGDVEVKLQFKLPLNEPIGEHRIWYRWAYYNPYTGIATCAYDVDCLGPATVDGQNDPFFWSKYTLLTDYFSQDQLDWTITIYWIMCGLSGFGFFSIIPNLLVRLYLGYWLLTTSWGSYQDFRHYHYIEAIENQVIEYLAIYNAWHLLFGTLMTIFTWPGPIPTVLTTLGVWTYIEVESAPTDYNNFYNIQKYI